LLDLRREDLIANAGGGRARCCGWVEVGDPQLNVLGDETRQLGEYGIGVEVRHVANEHAGLPLGFAQGLGEELAHEKACL
jgi:hypothetical protein